MSLNAGAKGSKEGHKSYNPNSQKDTAAETNFNFVKSVLFFYDGGLCHANQNIS